MIDEILIQVEKPARYIGNEINMVVKDPKDVDIRFAFCFPDSYEVGMSYVGLQILYFFMNRRDDVYCERVFAPWHDMEQKMRENNIDLFTLETGTSVKEFDFVGFTLQYEMTYTNIINMLNLGNIPIWSKDRTEDDPIIIAGGPCAYNPEPLAEIIDIFYIGEGEVKYDEFFDLYKEIKKQGGTKEDFYIKLLKMDGIYIPKFYDVEYKENGEIKEFKPLHKDASKKIKKVIVKDMDNVFYPDKQLVPLIDVVHDRVSLEVFRGCIRGCRFCQAGYVYRPVREKSADAILKKSKTLVETSGHEEVSLTSLSTADYSDFRNLSEGLLEQFKDEKVNIALPSLRIDAFSIDLMQKVQGVRKSSLTFAPEAGTQRLRDVINKGITEEEILRGSSLAFEGGWDRVKLYFMVGLPTETYDDVKGIAKLASDIVDKFYELPKEKRNRGVSVTVSSSCFVPKAFTPFQWSAQDTCEEFIKKQYLLKDSNERKQVKVNYHEPAVSSIEGILARGDRKVAKLIVKAWENGAKFDGWTESFKYDAWLKALEQTGLSREFYANRERSYDEILPWDHISIGVSKRFFIEEMEKAKNVTITPNCRQDCSMCGAKVFGGGVCFE
ncbi:TIGR03960 family B12-binding radical SAM protein [uncultured Tyzzerella sp.]|uniref:TIGR03960 family B12-binding radical SAM protein n=1 Tax=uncultured Tyzzerella sp. TaxID=2321398 RepID=UPI0029439EBE|nr:TIGR03960 family B12-binding radical SAM protein [uncultured Tyzzerella sp.]